MCMNECVLILIRNRVLSASVRGEVEETYKSLSLLIRCDSVQGWKTVPLGPNPTFGGGGTHTFFSTPLGSVLGGL